MDLRECDFCVLAFTALPSRHLPLHFHLLLVPFCIRVQCVLDIPVAASETFLSLDETAADVGCARTKVEDAFAKIM